MRRVAVCVVLALVVAACGGSEPEAGGGSSETGVVTTQGFGGGGDGTGEVAPPSDTGSTCLADTICEVDYQLEEVVSFDDEITNLIIVDGSAFATTDVGELMEIDLAEAAVVATYSFDGPAVDVAALDSEIWVLTEDGPGRFDSEAGALTIQGSLPALANPTHIAVDESGVWVSTNGTGEVALFDRATGEQLAVITEYENLVAPGDARVTAAGGFTWVIDREGGRVLQIDPEAASIVGSFDQLGFEARDEGGGTTTILAQGPLSLTTAEGSVWVVSDVANPEGESISGIGEVYRIDPASGSLEEVVRLVGDPEEGASFAVTPDAIWYIEYTSGELIRVDRSTGLQHRLRATDTFYSGNAVAATDDRIYVGTWGVLLAADIAAVRSAVGG